MRTRFHFLFLLTALLLRLPAFAFAEDAEPAHPVLAWNQRMIDAIRAESSPPALAARNLALLHAAIHDAMRGLPDPAAQSKAADSAGATVFAALYPSRALAPIASGKNDPHADAGLRAARHWLAERDSDGIGTDMHYVPRTGPGQWRRPPSGRPPELPSWSKVRPFVLPSADHLEVPPPPAPGSEAFREALEDVRRFGGKVGGDRSEEQSLIARFWSDFSYTSTPPGHWNEIARNALAANGSEPAEAARVLALLNIALADSAIACWEVKYRHNFWRPRTALHAAGHADWEPFLNEPPHPDYVSGHSTFSGAAAAVLEALVPVPAGGIVAHSDTLPGVIRRFATYTDIARECGRSRVYGGIHYEFSNQEGQALGRRIGEFVLAHALWGHVSIIEKLFNGVF